MELEDDQPAAAALAAWGHPDYQAAISNMRSKGQIAPLQPQKTAFESKASQLKAEAHQPPDGNGNPKFALDVSGSISMKLSSVVREQYKEAKDVNASIIKRLQNISNQVENVRDEDDIERILEENEEEETRGYELSTFDPGAYSQKNNKDAFVKNYGIQKNHCFSFYIMDSKIYPKDFDVVFQVYKWVIPESETKFRDYREDGTSYMTSPTEFGKTDNRQMIQGDVFIRLM